VGGSGGRVVPPERRYDQLLHAVIEALHRHGYTPVARRSTETTSWVLLHRAAGEGAGQRSSYLLVVHSPRERCLHVRLYSGAALSTGPPERQVRYYYQASRPQDLRRIVREVVASIPPPA
jgi:hypothetical protein